MRTCLSKGTNADISGVSWQQASLPIAFVGLGVRQTQGLSLPAFLVSANSAFPLAQQIADYDLVEYLQQSVD